MKRYVLISLVTGMMVALVVLVLYFLGVFEPAASWLNRIFESRGFYPGTSTALRFVWIEVSVITLTSIWICWCLADLIHRSQKLIVLGVFLLVTLGIAPSLALYGLFFDPFSSVSAVLLGAAAAFGLTRSELGKRKKTLQTLLNQRVSRATFAELMDARKPPKLDGQSREVTVITCRLFNRAELTDEMKAGDFLRMTNLFRRVTSGVLASHGAYLDEASPEIIRAYFGLLQPDTDHATKAARAAIDLRPSIKTLNQECQSRWNIQLQPGIGLSSGQVIVGIYGSKEQFSLSGIGAEVDFSRRLSKANLRYHSDILIGPKTFTLVQDLVEVRPMEMFYDPETGGMTEIYQLLEFKANFPDEDRKLRDHYWQGIILFREGKYREAIESFSKARIPGTDDGPLEFFIETAQQKLNETQTEAESKSQLTGKGHSRLLGNL